MMTPTARTQAVAKKRVIEHKLHSLNARKIFAARSESVGAMEKVRGE